MSIHIVFCLILSSENATTTISQKCILQKLYSFMGDKRLKNISETRKKIKRDNFSLNRKNCLYIITVSKTNSILYNTQFLKIMED